MEAALSELKRKLRSIWPRLDVRTRRLTATNEAMSLGYGGMSLVHQGGGRKAAVSIRSPSASSNGYRLRLRLWKRELQKFADQTGLTVSVCHFPRGTNKWSNRRGEPPAQLRPYSSQP